MHKQIAITSLHHKTHVAELWHGEADASAETERLHRMADCLLAIKRELAEQELHALDAPINIAMPVDGLEWPAAALLAKQRGLVLNRAVCGASETDTCGQFLKTGRIVPSLDILPALEVILTQIGAASKPAADEELCLTEPELKLLRSVIAVDVVTDARRDNFTKKIHEATEYVLHPRTARTYNALQDYRVMWADGTPGVILALENPLQEREHLSALLNLPQGRRLEECMETGRKRFLEY